MRIYCLNGDPNYPCFVLTIKGCTLMLDCSLNMKQLMQFLPQTLVQSQKYENLPSYRAKNGQIVDQIKEINSKLYINSSIEFLVPEFNLVNVEDIDAVLISNYHSMLALPYLTRMKQFRGDVFCTEPTLTMGRMLMEEMCQFLKSTQGFHKWKKTPINAAFKDLTSLTSFYYIDDVNECISRVKIVSFNQKINLFGSISVIPHSAGSCIGSCNWSIEADCDSVVYLTKSSVITTHTKQFDDSLVNDQLVDCLLISGMNQAIGNDPEIRIQEFCKAVVSTIRQGGNVLVPTYSTGKIYDLIECLNRHLSDASLQTTPVYFISSVANQSLAFSNIFGEWLSDSRLNQVYQADAPFVHGELVKMGFLKVYSSINEKFNLDYKTPCVLFASHPSLRFGEAVHFVDLWKNSPLNAIIFTESDFNYIDCLAPYQPVYASYYYFPIDTSLNAHQINKLIREAKSVTQVVLSETYDDVAKQLQSIHISTYRQNDVIKLIAKRKYEQCSIEVDLANTIGLKQAPSQQASYALITAHLETKNNQHSLKRAPKTIPLTRRDRLEEGYLKKYVYGKLTIDQFESGLKSNGITLFKSRTNENFVYEIEFDEENMIEIDLSTNSVHVRCSNEDLRGKVRDCLLKCVNIL